MATSRPGRPTVRLFLGRRRVLRPDWRKRGIACSSLLVRTPVATKLVGLWDGYRESEQSWKELLLDLKAAGSRRRQPWLLGMGHWDFGRHSARCTGRPAGNGVGCIRRPTCWTSCPKTSKRRPNSASRRSGWRPTASGRRWRLTCSLPPTRAKYPKAAECLAQDREVL